MVAAGKVHLNVEAPALSSARLGERVHVNVVEDGAWAIPAS
jgi:hypothetical protein